MIVWIGFMALFVAGVASMPPGPKGDAGGPACGLLPRATLGEALGGAGDGSREEGPISLEGTPVNVCGYVSGEWFGRGGGDFAWLYVAAFRPDVSPERAVRDIAEARQLSSSDYRLEPSRDVGDASWFSVTPPQFSPRQDLCLAAVRTSAQAVLLVCLFVSGKFNPSPSRSALIGLVQSVLDRRLCARAPSAGVRESFPGMPAEQVRLVALVDHAPSRATRGQAPSVAVDLRVVCQAAVGRRSERLLCNPQGERLQVGTSTHTDLLNAQVMR